MGVPAIIFLAVALGVDAFSMAVGVGMMGIRLRQIIIISLVIGFFHIIMPLTGLFLGQQVGKIAGELARITGSGVLVLIGIWWLVEIFRSGSLLSGNTDNKRPPEPDDSHVNAGMMGLMLLAVGVSLDALAVGFGLGLFEVHLAFTVIIFGVTAALMTALGFFFGQRISGLLGEKAKLAAAIILIAIGINIYYW